MVRRASSPIARGALPERNASAERASHGVHFVYGRRTRPSLEVLAVRSALAYTAHRRPSFTTRSSRRARGSPPCGRIYEWSGTERPPWHVAHSQHGCDLTSTSIRSHCSRCPTQRRPRDRARTPASTMPARRSTGRARKRDRGLCNAVMGAAPGSRFLDAALQLAPHRRDGSLLERALGRGACDALRDAVTVLEPKAFFPFYFSNAAHFLSASSTICSVVHLFGAGRWNLSDENRGWLTSRANEAPFGACGRRARRPSRAWRSIEVATASWRAGTPRHRAAAAVAATRTLEEGAGRARVRARRDADRGELARF